MAKQEFLVARDVATGAVWAFVRASSDSEITTRYPELRVERERPRWLDSAEVRFSHERMTVDIDDDGHPFLLAIREDRL